MALLREAALETPEEIARAILVWIPRAQLELKVAGHETAVPNLDYYLLTGAKYAAARRRFEFELAPRSAWWALVRLGSMLEYCRTQLTECSFGDPVLTRVIEAIGTGAALDPGLGFTLRQAGIPNSNAPVYPQIVLELRKVHECVTLDLDLGRAITADLRRYRQKLEWFDVETLDAIITKEEEGEKKIAEREKVAVRHLSSWLLDQGYAPMSKTLGVSKTDLEGVDTSGAFVVEAKIVTEGTVPKTQEGMDTACRAWGAQAVQYADVQGVQLAVVVLFNRTKTKAFTGSGPHAVGSVLLYFVTVNATGVQPHDSKSAPLLLRWM